VGWAKAWGVLICHGNKTNFQGGLGETTAEFKGLVHQLKRLTTITTITVLFSKVDSVRVCVEAQMLSRLGDKCRVFKPTPRKATGKILQLNRRKKYQCKYLCLLINPHHNEEIACCVACGVWFFEGSVPS